MSDEVQILTNQLNTLKPMSVNELNELEQGARTEMQQQFGFINVQVKKLFANLEDQSKIVGTTAESVKELLKQLKTLTLTIVDLRPDIERWREAEPHHQESEMQDYGNPVSKSSTINTLSVINLLSQSISSEILTAPFTPISTPSHSGFPQIDQAGPATSVPVPISVPTNIMASPSFAAHTLSGISDSKFGESICASAESGLRQTNPGNMDPTKFKTWDEAVAAARTRWGIGNVPMTSPMINFPL